MAHRFCSRQFSPSHSQYRQTVPAKKGVQIEHPHARQISIPQNTFKSPRLKLALKGKGFDDISDMQRNVTRLLNPIPKENFLQSFKDMHSRSQWCIVMGGDYFEGQSMKKFSCQVSLKDKRSTTKGVLRKQTINVFCEGLKEIIIEKEIPVFELLDLSQLACRESDRARGRSRHDPRIITFHSTR
ncbi:uncharacterized protein TNCV_2893241 [Trichonephila clavipes]|nr:uncharacterized protein TNCV_2893241 [Trichonephila clavipes]